MRDSNKGRQQIVTFDLHLHTCIPLCRQANTHQHITFTTERHRDSETDRELNHDKIPYKFQIIENLCSTSVCLSPVPP